MGTYETLRRRVGETPHLELAWDDSTRSLWLGMSPSPLPCFTPTLVDSILRVTEAVKTMREEAGPRSAPPVAAAVMGSKTPGVFSTGGDLGLITTAIAARDEATLAAYAHRAMDACHAMVTGFGADLVTVAMVDGMAFGSGFEAARCCDVVVATPASRFGLPEGRFGLHPGHGAMSVMSRRTSLATMRRLIVEGATLTAAEALDEGLVDVLAPQGEDVGEATRRVVVELVRRRVPTLAVHRGWHDANGVTRESMRGETSRWVASALALGDPETDTMRRIVAAQSRQFRATNRRSEVTACP